MNTSFDVRLWQIRTLKGAKSDTFQQRWRVGERRQPFAATFATYDLAEGFRDQLRAAMRRGEAFDTATGYPPSLTRGQDTAPKQEGPTWYDHARDYSAYKWPRVSGKQRASIADILTTITSTLLPAGTTRPAEASLRKHLKHWAFVSGPTSGKKPLPQEVTATLDWVGANSPALAVLDDPDRLRGMLDTLSRKGDGTLASNHYFNRRRAILFNTLKYAVTRRRLAANPLERADLAWEKPNALQKAEEVDPRSVGNIAQVESMLTAVSYVGHWRGPHMVAFFACMYYAMMRPSEAINLKRSQCELPEQGWGRIVLEGASPVVGSSYTDTGHTHEDRCLKQKAQGATRPVPIPPRLVALLRHHIAVFGTAADGRLFRTKTGKRLDTSSYRLVWQQAFDYGLTIADRDTPRLRRPYDLRHSGVSLRRTAGIPSRQVADWAGHSVQVLENIYSKVLEGYDDRWQKQIDDLLKD